MNVIQPHSVSIGHRADPHRHEQRTRLRVKVRPRSLLLGGCSLKAGESLIEVAASVVPQAMGLVEDPAKLKNAEEAYKSAKGAWERTNPGEPFMGSIGASFRTIYARDPFPLDACELEEEGIAPALTEEDRRVAAVVQNISTTVANDSGPTRRNRGNK